MTDNKKALENESLAPVYSITPPTNISNVVNYNNGFVKLHRQLLVWEWYSDLPVRVLFLHCLLKANYKNTKWKGKEIKAGEFITSLNSLEEETALTRQQIRTALFKLKSTHEITHKSTRHYSIITVNNWDKWQTEQHTTQQSSNTQATLDKEYKERKEIYKNNKDILKNIFSLEEYSHLDSQWYELINQWLDYKKSRNQSYKNAASIKAFINKLLSLSDSQYSKAKQIIETSLANNWSGIFELKQDKKEDNRDYVWNPNL